jgi:hypothetical protein
MITFPKAEGKKKSQPVAPKQGNVELKIAKHSPFELFESAILFIFWPVLHECRLSPIVAHLQRLVCQAEKESL